MVIERPGTNGARFNSIRETARRTEAFLELDEDKKEQLDEKMHVLQEYYVIKHYRLRDNWFTALSVSAALLL